MEKEFKTLQLFYASALVDSVYHYDQSGILNSVAKKKKQQQALTASTQLQQLSLTIPEELFLYFTKVFGCINWEITKTDKGITAYGKNCLLCSLAKKKKTAEPCSIYCINPIEELLKAMDPSFSLKVEKTLWNDDQCLFKVVPENSIGE